MLLVDGFDQEECQTCPVSKSTACKTSPDRDDSEVPVLELESQPLLSWLPEHEEELLKGVGVRLVKSWP